MPVPAYRLPVPLLPTAVTLSGFLIHSFWPGLRAGFGLAPDSVIDDAVTIAAGSAGWLGLAWLGVRVVDGLLRRLAGAHHAPAAPRLVSDLARFIFFGLAGVAVAGFVLNLPVTGLLATSGVLIAVLGFALRGVLSDVFSGIAINVEHPYRIGDWLQIGSGAGSPPVTGRVIEVNWRSTRLMTNDGTTVVMPNGLIAASRFVNYSMPEPCYRTSLRVHLDPAIPVERARRILTTALLSVDNLLANHPSNAHPSDVVVEGTDEAGVSYLLRFWVPDYGSEIQCRNAVATAMLNTLRHAGLAVAAPRLSVVPLRHANHDVEGNDLCGRMLRTIDLFQAFTPTELDDLADRMTRRCVPSGATVFHQGDPGASLFLLTEGVLEVRASIEPAAAPAAAPMILDRMRPGDIFGEMALLTGEPRSATVVALCEAIVFELSDEHLRPMLHDRAELAERLSDLMATRARRNAEKRASALKPMPPAPVPQRHDLLNRLRRFFALPGA
jgi:small-conductance mechanosensitive channel/CRP-like cAMP-binding protein